MDDMKTAHISRECAQEVARLLGTILLNPPVGYSAEAIQAMLEALSADSIEIWGRPHAFVMAVNDPNTFLPTEYMH